MRDLLVRRIYTKNNIHVAVELDFVNKRVSLTDKDGHDKSWIFVNRTPEYLNGWLNILKAMEYAVTQAKKEMDALTKKEETEFIQMYVGLDQSLKTPKNKLK